MFRGPRRPVSIFIDSRVPTVQPPLRGGPLYPWSHSQCENPQIHAGLAIDSRHQSQEAESRGHSWTMSFLLPKGQFACHPSQAVTMLWLKFLLLISLRNYRQPEGDILNLPPPSCPQLQAPVPSPHATKRPPPWLSQGAIPLFKQPPHCYQLQDT